jgi:hypothetical protein
VLPPYHAPSRPAAPHAPPPRRDAATGALKGDGSVSYVLEASVELAVDLLDGVDLRPGCVACSAVQYNAARGCVGVAAAHALN